MPGGADHDLVPARQSRGQNVFIIFGSTMKKLLSILLLFTSLQLPAQEAPRSFGDMIYGDIYLGLMFTGEYVGGAVGLGLGYRFNDRHALGLAYHGFTEGSISTTRSATGLGLQYRYQLKRWAFDAGAGYVPNFRYTGDDPFPTEAVQEGADPWYFRLGVRRLMRGGLYLGLSYAQSGDFVLKWTDTDVTPPEIIYSPTRGVYAFTLNFGLLLQKR
jgi:hypothetical protein